MRNFQDTFETHKRSYISAFSIWMTILFIWRKIYIWFSRYLGFCVFHKSRNFKISYFWTYRFYWTVSLISPMLLCPFFCLSVRSFVHLSVRLCVRSFVPSSMHPSHVRLLVKSFSQNRRVSFFWFLAWS